jgi:hypothetical protein
MTGRGTAYATITFFLLGGMAVFLGDQIAAKQLNTGRAIALVGVLIFCIPFLYLLFRRKGSGNNTPRRNVILTARTPSVKASVRRYHDVQDQEEQRQEIARQIDLMQQYEEFKRSGQRPS